MKKRGGILALLVVSVLLISIISFASFVCAEVNETEGNNDTVSFASNESNDTKVSNSNGMANDTEANNETNETEIEYTNEELELPDAGITPDSALYGVDVFFDNARATLTPGALGKAKVRLNIVEERMAEMEEMVVKNKTTEAKKAELEGQKQIEKFESSVEKIKKIKKKDALELKERIQRNAVTLEILKQRLIDYDSDWADAMADALEIMKTSENIIADIPEDFDPKPTFVFSPGTSTFESMIAQCIESGESPEECEKIEDFCKELKATTAEECVEMLSSGFLTPTFRVCVLGDESCDRQPDPHNCSGFHSSYITQKKYCCDDSDEDYSTEHREKTDDRLLDYYYIKGTVDYKVISLRSGEIEHEIYTDSCDGDKLTEWECAKQDRMLSEEYDCPNGCEDGACIACNLDSVCDKIEGCSCPDCEGKNNGCDAYYICQNGECVLEEVLPGGIIPEEFEGECTDSDGGQDYFVKGTTLGKSPDIKPFAQTYTDACMDDFRLGEGYCGDNEEIQIVAYSCPNGCQEGVCMQE